MSLLYILSEKVILITIIIFMISIPKIIKSNSILQKQLSNFGQSILKMRRQKQAELAQKLKQSLNATYVSVTDTTLGTSSCGQMYNILVESPVFQGKNRVQQHQLVSSVISEQLKSIHGFNLKTKIPKKMEDDITKKKKEIETEDNDKKIE